MAYSPLSADMSSPGVYIQLNQTIGCSPCSVAYIHAIVRIVPLCRMLSLYLAPGQTSAHPSRPHMIDTTFFFWLPWFFIALRGLSLVVAKAGYSLVSVQGLLTAVAEHRLLACRLR